MFHITIPPLVGMDMYGTLSLSPPGDITRMAPALPCCPGFETINETTAAFDCRRSESEILGCTKRLIPGCVKFDE